MDGISALLKHLANLVSVRRIGARMAARLASLHTLKTDHIGRIMNTRSILSVRAAFRSETTRMYNRKFCSQWHSSVLMEVRRVLKVSGFV